MPVTKLMRRVETSVWGSGMALDAMAMDSWTMVTSPPRISPSFRISSSLPARSLSFEAARKPRRPPWSTFHPASTS